MPLKKCKQAKRGPGGGAEAWGEHGNHEELGRGGAQAKGKGRPEGETQGKMSHRGKAKNRPGLLSLCRGFLVPERHAALKRGHKRIIM